MPVSGYEIIEEVSGTFNVDVEFFPSDITFANVPANVKQEIQIQITTGASSVLEITFDGTNFIALNNGVGLLGVATFTIYVDKDTTLNMRNSDTASLVVTALVIG